MEDTLDHPKVAPFTRELGERLGLDARFVDFVLSKRPADFWYRSAPAEDGWTPFVPDAWDAAHPLWCCNADQVVLLRRGNSYVFAQTRHDDATVTQLATSTQGVLALLMIVLWEDELSDEGMQAAAQLTGFRHLDAVLAFVNAERSFDAYDAALDALVAELDRAQA